MNLNREGKSYRHRMNNAIVLVLKSRRMSAGTARHTILVIEEGEGRTTTGRPIHVGEQRDIDEVPAIGKWENNWEEI